MPTRRYHAVPMPPIRPTGAVSGWWSPNHRPSKLSAEPPVTSVQPLWRLVKDGHVAEARVRPIEGIGVELRYEWNGELRVSRTHPERLVNPHEVFGTFGHMLSVNHTRLRL
jgi:hypothetical protein